MRSLVLRVLPSSARERLLAQSPNWRKACPPGRSFIFDHYLGDLRVNIDTRFKVERIMWTGSYEADFAAALPRLVKPGHHVMDVGANVGALTLAFARAVGPDGRITAFEPAPPNRARLVANLALNPGLTERVTIVPVGVSDGVGELRWQEEPGNPGNGMLGREGKTLVSVTTLDLYHRQHPFARLDFLKVDVEGMEEAVFRGAEGLLKKFRPTLYFETLPRFRDGRAGAGGHADLTTWLAGFGYRFHRLTPTGELVAVEREALRDYTIALAE